MCLRSSTLWSKFWWVTCSESHSPLGSNVASRWDRPPGFEWLEWGVLAKRWSGLRGHAGLFHRGGIRSNIFWCKRRFLFCCFIKGHLTLLLSKWTLWCNIYNLTKTNTIAGFRANNLVGPNRASNIISQNHINYKPCLISLKCSWAKTYPRQGLVGFPNCHASECKWGGEPDYQF